MTAKDRPCVVEETVSFLNNPATMIVETIKVPVQDDTGALVGVLGIARDVTERRVLQ